MNKLCNFIKCHRKPSKQTCYASYDHKDSYMLDLVAINQDILTLSLISYNLGYPRLLTFMVMIKDILIGWQLYGFRLFAWVLHMFS